MKRFISILTVAFILLQSVVYLSGCKARPVADINIEKPVQLVTLNVFAAASDYSGLQKGWIAELLKEEFNVELNIITGTNLSDREKFKTAKNADIIIFKNETLDYKKAVKKKILYDWNDNKLVSEHGSYIQKHMNDAIEANKELNSAIIGATTGAIYGIGDKIAWSENDHEDFIYSWDIRWDLYKELDCPNIENLEDYIDVLEQMKLLYPNDDAGNENYAVSAWSDMDEDIGLVECVSGMVSAYYGYEKSGLGFYDYENNRYIGALDKESPYLDMINFFHELYKKGLLDKASRNQKYYKAVEKIKNGNVFTSLYASMGSKIYNTVERIEKNNIMCSLKPEEAVPLVYGISKKGNADITAIGAATKYPELCMDILNYFATPEGRMTMSYGPRGVTWNYDENGNLHFTGFGKKCLENPKTEMQEPFSGTFIDGKLKLTFSSWSLDAENPDANSETYNSKKWTSNIDNVQCAMEQYWRDFNNCDSQDKYFEEQGCTIIHNKNNTISFSGKKAKQELCISKAIIKGTWNAIYADTDNEYNKCIKNMTHKAKKYGYNKYIQTMKEKLYEGRDYN